MNREDFALKEKREEKKLSLLEIADGTRIPSQTLKALEELDIKNLPALPYARGFLKNYLKALDIENPEPYLSMLAGAFRDSKVVGSGESKPSSVTLPPVIFYPSAHKKRGRLLIWTLTIILTSILAAALYFQIKDQTLGFRAFYNQQSPFKKKTDNVQNKALQNKTLPNETSQNKTLQNETLKKTQYHLKKNSVSPLLPGYPLSNKPRPAVVHQGSALGEPGTAMPLKTVSLLSSRPTKITIGWKNIAPTTLILKAGEIKHIKYDPPIQVMIEQSEWVKVRYDKNGFVKASSKPGPQKLHFD